MSEDDKKEDSTKQNIPTSEETTQKKIEPEPIEVEAEKVGKESLPDDDSIDKKNIKEAYSIDKDSVEKLSKGIDENSKEMITDYKVKTGKDPQWWLVALNNGAYALLSAVPGLNILYLPILYANLKILPMFPKKKLKTKAASVPTKSEQKPEQQKKPFGTGKLDDNNVLGTGKLNDDNPFGTGELDNGNPFGTGKLDDNNVLGTGKLNDDNPFGTGSLENKTKNNMVPFGVAPKTNKNNGIFFGNAVDVFKGVKTKKASSAPTLSRIDSYKKRKPDNTRGIPSRN